MKTKLESGISESAGKIWKAGIDVPFIYQIILFKLFSLNRSMKLLIKITKFHYENHSRYLSIVKYLNFTVLSFSMSLSLSTLSSTITNHVASYIREQHNFIWNRNHRVLFLHLHYKNTHLPARYFVSKCVHRWVYWQFHIELRRIHAKKQVHTNAKAQTVCTYYR